jgi:hypothetical protein
MDRILKPLDLLIFGTPLVPPRTNYGLYSKPCYNSASGKPNKGGSEEWRIRSDAIQTRGTGTATAPTGLHRIWELCT